MDIFAEVIENGERTGLLGYREDLWRKNTGMDKRLVFKLFNETVNWRATMDLMIGRSLQLTLGARGLPVTCFSINVGDHDNMVYLERSANKWPLLPENFSFFLLEDGKPRFYRLRRDLIDLGGDYTLYNHHNQNIGKLDGKVFSIGGKWYGRVKSEHADPRLLIVLKLFCGMLIFNDDARRHMRTLARDVSRGQVRAQAREAGSRPLHEPAPRALTRSRSCRRLLNRKPLDCHGRACPRPSSHGHAPSLVERCDPRDKPEDDSDAVRLQAHSEWQCALSLICMAPGLSTPHTA